MLYLQIVKGYLNSLAYFINLIAPEKYENRLEIIKDENDNIAGCLFAENKELKQTYRLCVIILLSYGEHFRFEIKEGDPLPEDLQEAIEMLKELNSNFQTMIQMGDTLRFN